MNGLTQQSPKFPLTYKHCQLKLLQAEIRYTLLYILLLSLLVIWL